MIDDGWERVAVVYSQLLAGIQQVRLLHGHDRIGRRAGLVPLDSVDERNSDTSDRQPRQVDQRNGHCQPSPQPGRPDGSVVNQLLGKPRQRGQRWQHGVDVDGQHRDLHLTAAPGNFEVYLGRSAGSKSCLLPQSDEIDTSSDRNGCERSGEPARASEGQ